MEKKFADYILAKTRDDYDRIAADFSATRMRPWPELERFVQYVRPGDRVLDVGCGNGRAYQLFEGLAIDYDGIDVSEKLLRLAKEKWRTPLARFSAGSMLSIPFEDGTFDVVLAIAVLHHVPSREYRLDALRECARVLKPGGYLLMTNWARWKPRFLPGLLAGAAASLLGLRPYDAFDALVPWNRGSKAERYVRALRKGELARFARAAGLVPETMSYVAAGRETSPWKADNLMSVFKKS